jgi:hypothetical protein
LEHLLYRASVEVSAPIIGGDDIKNLFEVDGGFVGEGVAGDPLGRERVEAVLRESRWNKREAARRLRVSPSTLYKLIDRQGIIVPIRGLCESERNVP